MDAVFRRRHAADSAATPGGGRSESGDSSRARRLIVVAGSVDEWTGFSERQWSDRLAAVGEAAASAGVESLRIVPSSGSRGDSPPIARRDIDVDGCRVVADPRPDGRANLVAAINEVSGPITERALQERFGGADGDVDLVIVLGEPDVLPVALVWELAYAELVYVDADWNSLAAVHVGRSLEEFAVRQRRFGGVIE